MAYIVKRKYGKHGSDFLHAWCDEWGTSCMGSVKLAMKFDTKEAAEAAAIKAKQVCRGAHGPAQGVEFYAAPQPQN